MVNFVKTTGVIAVAILVTAFCSGRAWAEEGRSQGLKFNNLSVSPFVNLEYTFDSNVDYDKNNYKDSIFRINPGVDVSYDGNDWGLTANGWYAYDKYSKYDILDAIRYGENIEFYRESASGWKLVLGQRYVKSGQNDSILDGGRGLWRDRSELALNSALSYEVSERTMVTLTGMYSDLKYNMDQNQYAPLYGWQEWSVGVELSRKLTEKSNLLLNGSYQNYVSDGSSAGVSSQSTGYSLMAGLGSRATRKISYRALAGMNWFDYAGGDQLCGWTYSLDASWVMNQRWAWSFAASSYYQPSEREQNQAMEVRALSTGIIYRPLPKLTTRLDFAYRQEQNQYPNSQAVQLGSITEDRLETRLRADYRLMRYMSVYCSFEYQEQFSEDPAYEFERFRGTLGLNLRY